MTCGYGKYGRLQSYEWSYQNQQLSEDRVAEVKRYLVGRGIAESRITTIGFSGTKPRYGNDREETRRLNRRVELAIVK